MIKDKSMFYLSLILLGVSIVLSFPFPHRYPYGEIVFSLFHLPIQSENGLQFVGITSLLLMIGGIFFLTKSLEKYQGRAVIIAISFAIFSPAFLVDTYQKTFATGIDAISYSSEEGNCTFEMVDEETLHGECELPFKNYSSDDVTFTVAFHEDLAFEDDLPMMSLMNGDAPYQVTIKSKEYKRVKMTRNIDVSNMKNHIEGGEATGVDIIMKSNGKRREL